MKTIWRSGKQIEAGEREERRWEEECEREVCERRCACERCPVCERHHVCDRLVDVGDSMPLHRFEEKMVRDVFELVGDMCELVRDGFACPASVWEMEVRP